MNVFGPYPYPDGEKTDLEVPFNNTPHQQRGDVPAKIVQSRPVEADPHQQQQQQQQQQQHHHQQRPAAIPDPAPVAKPSQQQQQQQQQRPAAIPDPTPVAKPSQHQQQQQHQQRPAAIPDPAPVAKPSQQQNTSHASQSAPENVVHSRAPFSSSAANRNGEPKEDRTAVHTIPQNISTSKVSAEDAKPTKIKKEPQSSSKNVFSVPEPEETEPAVKSNVKHSAGPLEREDTKSSNSEVKKSRQPFDQLSLAKLTLSTASISLKAIELQQLTGVLSFEQAREFFPWIGLLHDEKKLLHPSLPYLAVVYNEIGRWNKEQTLLLASNDDLFQHVKWEIRVALLFRKYPQDTRHNLLRGLLSIPRDEALMIIALRTAQLSHEVILAPGPDSELKDLSITATIKRIKEWVKDAADLVKAKVKDAKIRCEQIQALLRAGDVVEAKYWDKISREDKRLLTDLANAKVLLWQLDTLVPYFCPYTGLIHVKTTMWDPSFKDTVKFHPLVEHAPKLRGFNPDGIWSSVALANQYENIEKFLSFVDLAEDSKGTYGPLVLNSLNKPETFVPFELFFSKDQLTQTGNYLREVTGMSSSFFFLTPPVAINYSETFYSVEGIMQPHISIHHGAFTADPLTLSLSEFAALCSSCFADKGNCCRRMLASKTITG